jgi:hypothetical protein
MKMSVNACEKCHEFVYLVEEIKCLEKMWHRSCFKCKVCHITLTLNNYNLFDKHLYCRDHVPKDPEIKRMSKSSEIQSNDIYSADFETTLKEMGNGFYQGDVEQKIEEEKKWRIVENGFDLARAIIIVSSMNQS